MGRLQFILNGFSCFDLRFEIWGATSDMSPFMKKFSYLQGTGPFRFNIATRPPLRTTYVLLLLIHSITASWVVYI